MRWAKKLQRFAVNREIFTPLKFSDFIGNGFSVFNSRMSNVEFRQCKKHEKYSWFTVIDGCREAAEHLLQI